MNNLIQTTAMLFVRAGRLDYRRANRVRINAAKQARRKKRYAEEPEYRRTTAESNIAWLQRHREQILRARRDWSEKNRDKVRASHHRSYEKHKEKRRAEMRKYAAENNINHIRRARKLEAEGTYTQKEWRAVCSEHGHLCAMCNQKKPLTQDHIIPLSKGGSNWISNIQPLCRSCNSKKGARLTGASCDAIKK